MTFKIFKSTMPSIIRSTIKQEHCAVYVESERNFVEVEIFSA